MLIGLLLRKNVDYIVGGGMGLKNRVWMNRIKNIMNKVSMGRCSKAEVWLMGIYMNRA